MGQIHSEYSTFKVSGENSTVYSISDYLSKDHNVIHCLTSTKSLSSAFAKFLALIKFFSVDNKLVNKLKSAEIILVHNQVPFISAATIKKLCKSAKVVKVWHNYRPMCLNASLFRDGKNCQLCSHKNLFVYGVLYSCYRSSRFQSFILAVHNLQMRKILISDLHHVAVSGFVSSKILEFGVPSDRITVIYNASPVSIVSKDKSSRDFLILGRISQEKGIIEAISLWREIENHLKHGRKLHVVGDGDLLDFARLNFSDESIVYHGHLNSSQIAKIASYCSVGLITSLWEEPFGKIALEYLAHGLRVISTDKGGLPEILASTNSTILDSSEPFSLMAAIRDELSFPRVIDNAGAKKVLKHFDQSRIAQEWLNFLSTLAAK